MSICITLSLKRLSLWQRRINELTDVENNNSVFRSRGIVPLLFTFMEDLDLGIALLLLWCKLRVPTDISIMLSDKIVILEIKIVRKFDSSKIP